MIVVRRWGVDNRPGSSPRTWPSWSRILESLKEASAEGGETRGEGRCDAEECDDPSWAVGRDHPHCLFDRVRQ